MSGLGPESTRLDAQFAKNLEVETRLRIWDSAGRILKRGPLGEGQPGATGLALGYVQSGKTTSITALMAAAADNGYRVVIAFLGVTNLLLHQNQARIDTALGLSSRNDFRWVMEPNPSGAKKSRQIEDWLERGRVVFIPVLKHAGRIARLADVLSRVEMASYPTLIIDDEADQASLNVETKSQSLSRTYESITNLRASAPLNFYVQYTATPYAPLLIDQTDHLLPQFVEFLQPGDGYTGGKEFFVDFAEKVVRTVPSLDEQSTVAPIELPRSLLEAVASFVAGAALLLVADPAGSPVSMLVHSTHRNDIQARYHFLLERLVKKWRIELGKTTSLEGIPQEIRAERIRLAGLGAPDTTDELFVDAVKLVIREAVLWLVNSTEAVHRVNWGVAPVHILVGGNKLDRGFTVEGLTVTYMNRKPSNQIDTLEQRARAFGYRRDQLPYCQFFASKRTVKILRDIVFTEYDLRSKLHDHVEGGGSVKSWVEEIGLLLPVDTAPTRANVVRELSKTPVGWRSIRLPKVTEDCVRTNSDLVSLLGLPTAEFKSYGRREFRTMFMSLDDVINNVLLKWDAPRLGPDWRLDDIVEALRRHPHNDRPVPVILMEETDGRPRIRKWDNMTGFVNLFQGRDVERASSRIGYPGDRAIPNLVNDTDQVVLQVHRVRRRDHSDPDDLFTLAVHVGERPIIRGTPLEPNLETQRSES